jgi:hypothetical protein
MPPGFIMHITARCWPRARSRVLLEAWRFMLPPQYPPRSAEEVRARTLLGGLNACAPA